jgi:CubicO group peptidase (beta-lactamase class C family)
MTDRWTTTIDALLADAVAGGAVPGAVAVVAGPEGLRHVAAAGTLRAGGDEPVRPDTMFRYMSMTKALVSVAALQLVEQGRLGLDQEVASVLPAFGELEVLEGFDGDTPRLRPPARAATVRHLLTHTSGLTYAFADAQLLRHLQATGTPDAMTGTHAAIAIPLAADPGTRWSYGVSTDWLGQVVEAVSGQDLAAYLQAHLFAPLRMTDTTFAPSDAQRSRLMPVHRRLPEGDLVVDGFELPAQPEFWPGGHGAYGTAADYGRFLAVLLGGGELDGARVLQPETVALAFSDHLGGLPLPELMESAMPELSNDIVSMPFAQGWGLGFHLTLEDLPGMRRAGSGDWAGLCNSYYWVDRASGVAVALFTQILPFFDGRVLETALGLEQAVYAGLAEYQLECMVT